MPGVRGEGAGRTGSRRYPTLLEKERITGLVVKFIEALP